MHRKRSTTEPGYSILWLCFALSAGCETGAIAGGSVCQPSCTHSEVCDSDGQCRADTGVDDIHPLAVDALVNRSADAAPDATTRPAHDADDAGAAAVSEIVVTDAAAADVTTTPDGTIPPVCGDGTCNGIETCGTCAADCGACPPATGGDIAPCGRWEDVPAVPGPALSVGCGVDSYPTIQAAVDAASGTPGQTIILCAGTYHEAPVMIGGTALKILGRDGPAVTTIVGHEALGAWSPFTAGGQPLWLEGFTLDSAGLSYLGGADLRLINMHIANAAYQGVTVLGGDCESRQVSILDSVVEHNLGGILIMGGGNVLVSHSTIRNNFDGPGLSLWGGTARVEDSLVEGNFREGIYGADGVSLDIARSMLSNNYLAESDYPPAFEFGSEIAVGEEVGSLDPLNYLIRIHDSALVHSFPSSGAAVYIKVLNAPGEMSYLEVETTDFGSASPVAMNPGTDLAWLDWNFSPADGYHSDSYGLGATFFCRSDDRTCYDGTCPTNCPVGASCDSASICASGTCNDGVCVP